MTTTGALNWFNTQPNPSLRNPLSRAALLELLNDPANALTGLRRNFPLRRSNPGQYAALARLTSSNLELLARTGIDWYETPEANYLAAIQDNTYDGLITDLAPSLWYRMDDTASPISDYGSAGSAFNLTASSIGAFGASGANDKIPVAITFNGASSSMISPVSSLPFTDVTAAFLVNATSNGQSSAGFCIDCFASGSSNFQLGFFGSGGRLQCFVRNATLNGFVTSTGSDAAGVFPFATWRWIFSQYSTVTNQVRIWMSALGILTEFTYAAQPTLTGTLLQAEQITVGNNRTSVRAWDGKIAQGLMFPRLLTTDQMQSIIDISGVAA